MVAHVAQLVIPTPLQREPADRRLVRSRRVAPWRRRSRTTGAAVGIIRAPPDPPAVHLPPRRFTGALARRADVSCLAVHPQCDDHVMLTELDTVDVYDQDFELVEPPLAQLFELRFARRHELAADG
jgi:hypothetical protein